MIFIFKNSKMFYMVLNICIILVIIYIKIFKFHFLYFIKENLLIYLIVKELFFIQQFIYILKKFIY